MRTTLPLLFISVLISCTTPEPVDLIITNGSIYTMNDSAPVAEAVAIKEGKINPFSPPLRSPQQRPQGHPAKSKFLALYLLRRDREVL